MEGILRKTPKTQYHSFDEDSDSFHTFIPDVDTEREELEKVDPYSYDDDEIYNYDKTPDGSMKVFGKKHQKNWRNATNKPEVSQFTENTARKMAKILLNFYYSQRQIYL